MYKLLLVDDEANMRTRMIERIEWKKYGFDIVSDAENGLDALDKMETYTPDVVITDIKMPFMDGLELSKEIYKRYPLTKIIILTGFNDFEYAKTAINLKVIDYILKPITHDNLVEVLKRTKQLLDKEFEEKRDINRLKEYYKNSFPVMRNKVLQQLVSGRIPSNQIKDRLEYYKLKLQDGPYKVGIIALNKSSDSIKARDFENQKLMLSDIADSIVNESGIGVPFVYEDYIVIIICLHDDIDKGNSKLESTLYEISQYVEKFMSFRIKISIGNRYDDKKNIHLSFLEAKSALDYATSSDSNEIIYIKDMEPNSSNTMLDIRTSQITRAIKSCIIEDIYEIIDNIFDDIVSINLPSKDYKFNLLEIILNIVKNASLQSVMIDESLYSQDKIIRFLKNTNSLNDAKKWIYELSEHTINEVLKIRDDKNMNYIKKAKKYIEENYKDENINIDKLCKMLFISPNYFSAMFKKATDMTFTRYLTQIRLDRAKELLKSTDNKSFEVAEKVGFSDANYFSYCFKKNVGLSPSQYRKPQDKS